MPSIPRYFANDSTRTSRDANRQLVASLNRIVDLYPPGTIPPGGGLYYGPISVAYLFFALQEFYQDLEIQEVPLGTWFAVYLKQAEEHMKEYPGPSVDRCGVSDDIMALIALSAASAKDPDMARELCSFVDMLLEPEANNEWLYGRAGYLYLLRLVRASFADDADTLALLKTTADDVIGAILASPRPFKWHGKVYVGAVHGVMGIITQVVLTDASYAPKFEAELAVLLTYQYDSGNWPATLPPTKDRLVQFCHGAPGMVASLISIKPYFPALTERIDKAIATGRAVIKERGLLTKEPCLCHGISGNALAMDDEDFAHFLTYATRSEIKSMEKDGMLEKSEDPSALYSGEAGRAWAFAVQDRHLEKRFIGYNDI